MSRKIGTMSILQLISLLLSVAALGVAGLLIYGWAVNDDHLHQAHRVCICWNLTTLLVMSVAQVYVSLTDTSNELEFIKFSVLLPILASVFYYRTLKHCGK